MVDFPTKTKGLHSELGQFDRYRITGVGFGIAIGC